VIGVSRLKDGESAGDLIVRGPKQLIWIARKKGGAVGE
jgi:hypothetical protein